MPPPSMPLPDPPQAEPEPDATPAEAGLGEGATAAPTHTPTWTYTVSVRSLCEFTAKRGDLDRRFTPSATALEGLIGQAAVVARRRPGYESELALSAVVDTLRVRGRADGFDPRRGCLEEIKTIRGEPDALPDNRRHLHWAQLETYGALFCQARGLAELHLALVYVDANTQAETVQRQLFSAADLAARFSARCRQFQAWAQQESAHRSARDTALARLPFPPGEFRPGQRALAEAVYRAAVNQRCLLAQAPTGSGKTLGTLYPLLRAMPGQKLDKIGYLTCKNTGRITALDALAQLRLATPGRHLRVLALVAKASACEHPDKACHGDACPLARGFYDRLPAARAEAVQLGWLDPNAQRDVALRHGICPYYLGQELQRWVDVLVGDVHHMFDPNGGLFGLTQALGWRLGLLVDEAHNLVDRARQMHGAALGLGQLRAALAAAPAALRPPIDHLLRAATEAANAQATDYAAHATVPDAVSQALQALNAALGEHLQRMPLATGGLLAFYFEALRFQRAIDRFGPHSVFDIQREPSPPGPETLPQGLGPQRELGMAESLLGTPIDATFSIRNVVPAGFLRPRFAACHTVTLFSATLAPQAYQRDLLGLPENTAWIDLPSQFSA